LATPNVVLITIDTLRADHLHCYNYSQVQTPSIDAVAGQGVRFTRAYTPVPLTLPAHAALMTGSYPLATGVHDFVRTRLPRSVPTLAAILHQHGYRTAAFVSAIVLDSRFGLNAGFDTYFDRFEPAGNGESDLESVKRRGDLTMDLALGWLRQHAGSARDPSRSPFFLWVHLFDPHRPYDAPAPYVARYRTHPYDGEIAFDDAQVGRLDAALRARGLWDSTLLVLAADHGEGLGEHGEEGHGFFIYNSTLHVPLIIHIPGVQPRVVNAGVSLVDVMPTVLQALRIPVPASVQGHSLMPLVLGQASTSDSILYSETYLPLLHFGWSELRGLQVHELKYIAAPRPEVYNLRGDPHESHNLDGVEPISSLVLKQKLVADIRQLTPLNGNAPAASAVESPTLLEQLRSLGYLEASPHQAAATGEHSIAAPLADPKDRIEVYQLYKRAASDSAHGRYQASLTELRRAQQTDPNSPFLDYWQGFDDYRMARYAAAKQKLQAALQLDPSFALATYYLGRTELRLADFDSAISSLRQAVAEGDVGFKAPYYLGRAYLRADRVDDAIRSFQRALQLNPDYAPSYETLGAAYLHRQRPQDAVPVLRRALQLDPHLSAAHADLAQAYQALGRLNDARRERERAKAP
jgi:arylsulfatase A-like enzyme/lipoprotein NlpI